MIQNTDPGKPKTVFFAEVALWIWTAWACFFGIYQTWISIPEIAQQIQDLLPIGVQALREITVISYGFLAVLSIWVVLKIGEGKNWARSSLLWGFALEIVWTLCTASHEIMDYVTDIPDFGLQIYALYLLYTKPGHAWFERAAPSYKK